MLLLIPLYLYSSSVLRVKKDLSSLKNIHVGKPIFAGTTMSPKVILVAFYAGFLGKL